MTDKLNVNTIVPAGSTLTVGTSGGSVVMTDDVKVNTVKDAGGNTLWVSNGSGVLSSVNSAFGGSLKLIQTQTVTNTTNVDFTSGIDSTYKEYVFKFININPATDNVYFQFQCNINSANVVMTTTYFLAYKSEDGTQGAIGYGPSMDQAQTDGMQRLMNNMGNGAEECGAGELHLFNPASTTYVKHFYSRSAEYYGGNGAFDVFIAGYFNNTSAINAITFKIASGNIDAGTIAMYGVS